jgi:coenzyme F420-reducing hydrogenase delta subunit
MDYMNTIFFNLIKDIKPEMEEKIRDITKLVARNISESCKENLDRLVNAKVEKSLSIPNNVILHKDRVQTMKSSESDLKVLEEEVRELSNTVKEVS